jgi:glycosyltransferase involved in cell wall biosynthesis
LPLSVVTNAVAEGIIKWIPFREDVPQLYALATVSVVPTYYAEGTPKGILEGMAMGLPVVCTDVPSITALVSHRENALVVPPRSGRDIANAVIELLESPGLRERIGKAAREKAVAEFDADRAAAIAVREVYERIPAWTSRSM